MTTHTTKPGLMLRRGVGNIEPDGTAIVCAMQFLALGQALRDGYQAEQGMRLTDLPSCTARPIAMVVQLVNDTRPDSEHPTLLDHADWREVHHQPPQKLRTIDPGPAADLYSRLGRIAGAASPSPIIDALLATWYARRRLSNGDLALYGDDLDQLDRAALYANTTHLEDRREALCLSGLMRTLSAFWHPSRDAETDRWVTNAADNVVRWANRQTDAVAVDWQLLDDMLDHYDKLIADLGHATFAAQAAAEAAEIMDVLESTFDLTQTGGAR